MNGTSDKIKGKVQELTGKVTGDEKLEAKGKVQQVQGELKSKAEDAKKNADNTVNDAVGVANDKFDEHRENRDT